jgi:uncharacterized membrane protein
MSAITESIEISRRPDDVFTYIADLASHPDWQDQIVSANVDTDGPTRVGTRCTETRRLGGRDQTMTYEVVEHTPPRVFAFRGVDGPIRAIGRATIEPVDDGARSRVTLDLDFEGHGLGKLMLPLVRSQARKQVPHDQRHLKERLEQDQPAS